MILKDQKRPDGRKITEIRPLAAEVDIIPRVHGSAMFTRGQTQICNVCTLAPLSEVQRVDGLDENTTAKRYMHHYNFPSYSVGETKVSRGPGRREIGHGALSDLLRSSCGLFSFHTDKLLRLKWQATLHYQQTLLQALR